MFIEKFFTLFVLFARKTVLSTMFKKQWFFTFFETLCTKFTKIAINIFFWVFCMMFIKKCFFSLLVLFARKTVLSTMFKNSDFSHFSSHFEQSSQKMLENSVFWAFCMMFIEKCREQCFSTFFETLRTKIPKNANKQRFFELFARCSSKSVTKQCIFTFSIHSVRSSQKVRKTPFFVLFARKTVLSTMFKKQCFITFFETLCTKFAKNAKKQRFFLAFCTISCKKCEKTVFFHVFRDTLYKVRKKCEK